MSVLKQMGIYCVAFAILQPCLADNETEQIRLNSSMRKEVIAAVNQLLMEQYIFFDVAEKMRDHLNAKRSKGEYDQISDPNEFCSVIRQDLHDISKDNHFFLEFNPKRAALLRAQEGEDEGDAAEAERAFAEQVRVINYGFKKLEILRGNIGYLDLQLFADPKIGGDTAAGAMAFLANADAVIIDLRDCPGGDPTMVQLICSYFVQGGDDGRTHLNSFERRYNDSLEQFWTLPYVPGKTMYDMDLYVLISNNTGSGAEEFSYNMKNLKRATLVGETTRGSAHPIDAKVILDQFVMHLPTGRPINPISGTNWERVGVPPDLEVSPESALDTAYLEALKKLRNQNLNDAQKFQVDWAFDGLNARSIEIPTDVLEKYAGNYGPRTIPFKDGKLCYKRNGPARELIPLNDTTFAVKGLESFRIQFVIDETGKVTAVRGLYEDGYQDYSKRTD